MAAISRHFSFKTLHIEVPHFQSFKSNLNVCWIEVPEQLANRDVSLPIVELMCQIAKGPFTRAPAVSKLMQRIEINVPIVYAVS